MFSRSNSSSVSMMFSKMNTSSHTQLTVFLWISVWSLRPATLTKQKESVLSLPFLRPEPRQPPESSPLRGHGRRSPRHEAAGLDEVHLHRVRLALHPCPGLPAAFGLCGFPWRRLADRRRPLRSQEASAA